MKKLILLLLWGCYCLPYARGQGSCSISASDPTGCIPHPVVFTVTDTSAKKVKSYLWKFGDNSSSTQKNPSHIYTARGKYFVSLLITYDDNTICKADLPVPVVINGNPSADFDLGQNAEIILCKKGQSWCFTDKSQPGPDNASVSKWLWIFGDGGSSTQQNPCHIYNIAGTYQITLEVTDTNGCKDQVKRTVKVNYADNVGKKPEPKFKTDVFYDCQKNHAVMIFHNQTDTNGQGVTEFVWDYGDGDYDTCDFTKKDCKALWTGHTHIYKQTGNYYPSLTVTNRYGCTEKFEYDTAIYVEPYVMDLEYWPDTGACFPKDSLFQFKVNAHPFASYYFWEFGDPHDTGIGRLPFAEHIYSRPGTYSVRFRTKIYNCEYDTVLCMKVNLMGPTARIQPEKFYENMWDSVPQSGSDYLIDTALYASYFDTSCGGKPKEYWTRQKQVIPFGDTVKTFCDADTVFVNEKVRDCDWNEIIKVKKQPKARVLGFNDKILNVGARHVWYPGDPYPQAPVYSDSTFVDRPFYVNDSTLFNFRCGGPHEISFPNFSMKYRGYYAVDNDPLEVNDTCYNPYAPYASDSLQYMWDFREGTNDISTKTSPDKRARYSEEKLPTHMFEKDGCYWVKLTVTDPKTSCEDIDSIPVVMQQPDAGWGPEYSHIQHMTWLQQQSLPWGFPRRGMILVGDPCAKDTQGISLRETLPSCYKRDISIIWDSAQSVVKCPDGSITHRWYNKDEIENRFQYRYVYNDSGWVTVGVVVGNNKNCRDTVWYHNYKYLHGTYSGINTSAKRLCAGDTLDISPLLPQQQGIKLFTLEYFIIGDKGDTLKKLPSDTFNYELHTLDGQQETITSTVHNPDWGINDPASLDFNHLYDTLSKVIDVPGHLTVRSVAISRFGCTDTTYTHIPVGHQVEIYTFDDFICLGDSTKFSATVRYYVPFGNGGINDGYDDRLFWNDPDSARNGRKVPIPEEMRWDLDSDGTIDSYDPFPIFTYTQPGKYSVTLYTRDSSGCEQKTVAKDLVTVARVIPRFGVDSPGAVRYCAPHFFHFIDSSCVFVGNNKCDTSLIMSWLWDFGDGSPPLYTSDRTKKDAVHQYDKNGTYTITLTVRTTDTSQTLDSGCYATYQQNIQIVGPRAEFKIIGPNEGCVPFTAMIGDLSPQAKIREWRLGNGEIQTSNGEDTVYFTYTKPGVYCPEYFVADTIIDQLGNRLYCTDSFPEPKCKFKIIVHDINRLGLLAEDSVLCARVETGVFHGSPDTGYTSWVLDYGDGHQDENSTPEFSHIYDSAGIYILTLTGKGARCPDTATLRIRVTDVKADFDVNPNNADTPRIAFTNRSVNGVQFQWEFGDGSPMRETYDMDEVIHEYNRTGILKVCLKAISEDGCEDTICKPIDLTKMLFIPNVFTPNGDALKKNERFRILIKGEIDYELFIYNRWGEEVFHSTEKENTWDGTHTGTGVPYPEGTYYYVFRYRHIGDVDFSIAKGTVTLLR